MSNIEKKEKKTINVLPKDFIKEYLINQIDEIIKKYHPYLAFVLISAGFEFLGKCLNENKKWNYKSKSLFDVKNAIKQLMPKKYHSLNLENQLCDPMIHCLIPTAKLSLGYIKHGCVKKHLKKDKSNPARTIIEVSEFHKDFVSACNCLIKKIDKKTFKPGNKIYKPILIVG